jgi:hypothetical protein
MARKRIGEVLLASGVITPTQLEEGLALQRQTRQRLGVVLLQKGFLQESQLAQALSEATGIALVDLKAIQPEWSAIHSLRVTFCEAHNLFPFALQTHQGKKQLVVAMSDPLNAAAMDEIEFTTGLKVIPRIATLSAVRGTILRYYHRRNPDEQLDPDGMTIVQGPQISFRVPDVPAEEEVIEGEEVDDEVTARTQLALRIKEREGKERTRRAADKRTPPAGDAISKDLDYLFGQHDAPDPVEQLERKFWALMRLMARKGLLTNEEFTRELEEDSD